MIFSPKFYVCDDCKTVIEVICGEESEKLSCCSALFQELVPNTSEGAAEKHLPVIEQNGNCVTVKVGSVDHPMSEEHSITWVYLQTQKGAQRTYLSSSASPSVRFMLAEGDTPVAAYAFCNLHGFWKTEA